MSWRFADTQCYVIIGKVYVCMYVTRLQKVDMYVVSGIVYRWLLARGLTKNEKLVTQSI